jgi:hypothetical protein
MTVDSPFPGMDPYLEEPGGWPSVHHRLIGTISDLLVEQVAPHYSVQIEERVYLTDDDDAPETRQRFAPNLYLVQHAPANGGRAAASSAATPATLIEPLFEPETRDRFLTIHDRRSRELVTTIELISPWNKARGARGQKEFLAKRELVFGTRTHWIEIDLLRAGERPDEVAGKSDYYALLRRANAGGRLAVWFVDLRDTLPRISVPLRAPHPDTVLDLQAAFNMVYARARYADDVDYSRPVPPPELRPADAIWAGACVARWQAQRAEAGP